MKIVKNCYFYSREILHGRVFIMLVRIREQRILICAFDVRFIERIWTSLKSSDSLLRTVLRRKFWCDSYFFSIIW